MVLNVLKNGVVRIYYKSDGLVPLLDVRFTLSKINGDPIVTNVPADGEVAGRGVYFYDLTTPNEDIYIVGRGYYLRDGQVTDPEPLVLKSGNASPQALFFYSEREFPTSPSYRIYDILGDNVQDGNLASVSNTFFWYTFFTAAVVGAAESTFFFEVESELLAKGFTLDVTASGLIAMQGIANISLDGTLVPSPGEEKEAQSIMRGIASSNISAVFVPNEKNTFCIGNEIQDNSNLIDLINNTFQNVIDRLINFEGIAPLPNGAGSNFPIINIINNRISLPNIDVLGIKNKISNFGQVVPITPIGGEFEIISSLNVKIDIDEKKKIFASRLSSLNDVDVIPSSGSKFEFANRIGSIQTIIGNISIPQSRLDKLRASTLIPVVGGLVMATNAINGSNNSGNVTALQRRIKSLTQATPIPVSGGSLDVSKQISTSRN